MQEKQYEYFIPYSISGGEIQKIGLDCSQASMMIYLQNTENGTLAVVIPRTLLDSKLGDKDEYIFALVDGYEVDYKETKSSDSRALDISFPLNTQKIEILVSYVFGPGGPPHPKIDCGASVNGDSIYYHLMSPLKQTSSGVVPEDVTCKDGYELIFKSSDNSPACVKPESITKLVDRGWAKEDLIPTFEYVIIKDTVTYGSSYQIAGGLVDEIHYDKNSNSLIVSLSKSETGYLKILIQNGVLHPPRESSFNYFVLIDGEEVMFEKLSPILLKIPFEKGTKLIEIIGTNPI